MDNDQINQTPSNSSESETTSNKDAIKQQILLNKKILLLSVVLLVTLVSGLAVLFVWLQNNAVRQTSLPAPVTIASPQPTFTLTLESPTYGELAINNEILVRGKTQPNVTIIIFTDTDDTSVVSDEQGNFESTISLASGINTLTISAFADDGQEKNIVVDVVHDSI